MAKMLKTQLPRSSIIWIAPVQERVGRGRLVGEVWYVLRMIEPYARTSGASMKDRPPIELLATMGIKVGDKGPYPATYNPQSAYTWNRYNVIGCRYEELTLEMIQQRNLAIDPMVFEHLKESKKVTNSDVETLMPLYDELIPGMNGINEPITVLSVEEEGWITI